MEKQEKIDRINETISNLIALATDVPEINYSDFVDRVNSPVDKLRSIVYKIEATN